MRTLKRCQSTGRDAKTLAVYLDWNQPAPPKTATVIPVSGEDGKPISLPDWFPQVNLEELSDSIKAQWLLRPISKWLPVTAP
ncbi:MAG: hypothetical protein H8E44_40285 [Planctomycetes bacterium]|nr:hypothetical protein [Planctomycetota bacterium]